MNNSQITSKLLMIRPVHFGFNNETAVNNLFQINDSNADVKEIKERAQWEFDELVRKLKDHGISVQVFEDTADPIKTDAVFPNNWITLHEDGTVVTYPLFSAIRRKERREDIIEELGEVFDITKRYSFDYYENKKQFLEGTGSMVLDRVNKIAYACLSPRTHIQILEKFVVLFGFEKCVFHAKDKNGELIYHTNVMMALGEEFVMICLDSVKDEDEKKMLKDRFQSTGKEIIEITMDQMHSFAGNMLQVKNQKGEPFLIMSERAFRSLEPEQVQTLRKYTDFIYSNVETIENYGGGSVRCMIAENFLPAKDK